ncbi:adenylate/guanylate cyclase domain-containing protein [Allomuricauda sp. SCSIO 65647]|uniref:adenylate/guanylate cyclase domain-containing protein n=1 Tax=Allomuricauda sp. SCSIO 65647 TaxID=2908843 RepID=UPI001F19510A|nr:adenylate/guanylate cyclase domain-containing protein [Muricauda sp. SCSIO 65647]UJH68380.1 adenylate/guanylate cyclase domain-containing protein [Muricauda sp. SCSIO 65647]
MNYQNKNLKEFFKQLGRSVVFWIIAMALFAIFRYYGLSEEEGVSTPVEYSFSRALSMFVLFGLGIGFLSAFIEFFLDKYLSKKVSIGLNLIISSFIYLITIVFLSTLTIEISNLVYDMGINNNRGWWVYDKTFWTIIIYIALATLVSSFIQIANDKFGKGVFLKMLFGKYRKPKEEKRIFMFLDLKSSTTIAEKLGHFKYSQLIQDCFYDLNEVVPGYDAEIYQYVGDEAVLSWPYEKGLSNNNCVRLFFAFKQKLLDKNDYYINKYGTSPEFKAGLHGGVLMVAEVGVIKKEVAYHGDVINTSARIQAECNTHNVTLLISEKLLNDLHDDAQSATKFLGSVLLKGKQKEVKIHSILNYDREII